MAELRLPRNAPCSCGSGLKFKKCCLLKKLEGSAYEGPEKFAPQPVFSDGAAVLRPLPKQRAKTEAIQRVRVEFTFREQFGPANVWYYFPVGRLVALNGGFVLPVERLDVGARFLMQGGEIATVTAVEPPEWWEPPADQPVKGRQVGRVVGWVERIGNVVIDLSFLAQTVTTTPDHPFWSATRKTYVPAALLRPGELLATDFGGTATVDSISPPRYGLVKLYNIEVERIHSYFVGAPNGAVLVHNGVPGAAGCGVPMPAEAGDAASQGVPNQQTSSEAVAIHRLTVTVIVAV